MKRVSKLHFGDIGKSFSMAFIFITIVWSLVSFFSMGVVCVSWQILAGNFAVSAMLAAFIYKLRYHRVLEYNKERFTLRTGRVLAQNDWKNFSLVSLYHKGYEIFTLRLYRNGPDEPDFVDLPATELGLNASDFRYKIEEFISPRRHGERNEELGMRN
jgi:hypothetical protein